VTSLWTDDLMPGGGRPRVPSPTGPTAPTGPPRRGGLPGAVVALIVVVAVGLFALPVASLTRNSRPFWPDHWDPRIAPIAQSDAQIRGLQFEHPVVVKFLPEKKFKKLAADSGDVGAAARAETEREAATFRALGFISGNVDLFDVTRQADEAGVLAFYDFNKKEIVVRGTTLDVSHRATLAHELTHVLQDQHFDIRSIQDRSTQDDAQRGASSEAMLALIEGDANRVRDAYLKSLPSAQQSEYDREQAAEGATFGKATADVPPFVELLFSAPYDLGPLSIRMLIADGGNSSVNDALTGPTPTSAVFTQAGLISPPPPDLPAPTIATDEKTEGPSDSFGAFELYIMLATRDDPLTALTASDSILGGRAQGLRWKGRYCYRAMMATRDAAAANFVQSALQRWAKSASGASVNRSGASVAFTACDPGSLAVGASKQKFTAAEVMLGARSGIAVGAAESGASPGAARCVARLFAQTPGAVDTLKQAGSGTLSPSETTRVRGLVQQEAAVCKANPKAGLL
jgi:hypothetical protein